MRKIEIREDIERREKRNRIIIGVILVGIMLFSTAGYAFFSGDKNQNGDSTKADYNGRDFSWNGNYWISEYNGNALYFSYLPNETRNVNLQKTLLDYQNKQIYYTEESQAIREILSNLNILIGKNPQKACFQDENCTENIPVKNCSSNMIIIKEQYIGENPIREEENCVFIFSNDSVRDADAFLYKILGIK